MKGLRQRVDQRLRLLHPLGLLRALGTHLVAALRLQRPVHLIALQLIRIRIHKFSRFLRGAVLAPMVFSFWNVLFQCRVFCRGHHCAAAPDGGGREEDKMPRQAMGQIMHGFENVRWHSCTCVLAQE